MSYCRWSTDNFKCDVYAYHGMSGYYIHVAKRKHDVDLPQMPPINAPVEERVKANKERLRLLDEAEMYDIGLPYDGESFLCPTISHMYDKLVELREVGYHIPDYVFELVKEEMREEYGRISKRIKNTPEATNE